MKSSILAIATAFLTGCGTAPATGNSVSALGMTDAGQAAPILLKTADGVTVHGLYHQAAQPKALILLFHQAGSGKGEYAEIAPRLAAAGYSVLAIDQRAGGGLFGKNETAAGLGRDAGYLDALPDLQAALDWAADKQVPVVLWGSSYSSSLAFALAAANPGKVRALLAFSPGEYFDDKALVGRAAATLKIPVYVTTSGTASEVAAAKPVVAAVPGPLLTVEVPRAGVHGSSTLIAAKNPAGAKANWLPVMAFLRRIAP